MPILHKILVFVFAITASIGMAQEVPSSSAGSLPVAKISWEVPVAREDGTPLDAATELDSYELTCVSAEDETISRTVVIPATVETQGYQIKKTDLFPSYGQFECSMISVDNDGLQSRPSNVALAEWIKAVPKSATNLIIVVE